MVNMMVARVVIVAWEEGVERVLVEGLPSWRVGSSLVVERGIEERS